MDMLKVEESLFQPSPAWDIPKIPKTSVKAFGEEWQEREMGNLPERVEEYCHLLHYHR